MDRVSWRKLMVIFLGILVALMPNILAKQSTSQNNNPENYSSELDAMFSNAGSSEVFQLSGGQVRPFLPNNTTSSPLDIPYRDYLRDRTLFGDFLGLFEENLTPPQINSTWRDMYLESIQAQAPVAKGRMSEPGRPHLLKPVLIDEPQF